MISTRLAALEAEEQAILRRLIAATERKYDAYDMSDYAEAAAWNLRADLLFRHAAEVHELIEQLRQPWRYDDA